MNKVRRVVSNTIISLFGQLVTWTSTLLLTIAYGRFLGDVKFGELYLAITFVSLIGIPVEMGFNQQLTRDVAEDPDKAQTYLWNTVMIKVMLWVLLYAAMLLLAWLLGYSLEQRSIMAICGITLLSGSIVNTFAALHYAYERTLYPAIGMVLEKGLSASIGFILLRNGASVQTMAFVLLGGSLIDGIWVGFWFFRLVGWHVSISRTVARKLLHSSIPFVIYGILGVIYYRIDTVMLSLMTGAAVVGWYGAGYRLFDTLFFLPSIIVNTVMYPVFSKLASTSQAALKVAVEKCMNLLLISSVPIATLFALAATNIVDFLYHKADFVNTIPVIQWLAPGLIFIYINALFFNLIVTTKGEKKIPIMAGAALVFNLGLNLYMIPHYQQVGAAIVTSLTELLLLCISFVYVPKHLLPKGSIKVGAKVFVASILMGMAAFILRGFSIFVIGPAALVVYVFAATLLKTIPREDVQTLVRAFKPGGKGGSNEILDNLVDENVFTQVTQRLPAISMMITQNLPIVQVRESQPIGVELWGGRTIEYDETIRLPVVQARRIRLTKVDLDEENKIEDDTTIHLPIVDPDEENKIEDDATIHLPIVDPDEENKIEDDTTIHLPIVDPDEENKIEDDTTIHLPIVKAKRDRCKAEVDKEQGEREKIVE
jgi:O-antigen/teichoic acid export membrane protein